MKKIVAIPMLLIAVVSGCGKPGGPDAGGARVAITDSMNRKVLVPANPAKIGCLYAFAGHAVRTSWPWCAASSVISS